jgi:hypothetical protein
LSDLLDVGGAPAALRPQTRESQADSQRLTPLSATGFAIASIGGPFALVYQLLPGAIGSAGMPSVGLVLLLALVLFAFPLVVWWRFSGRVTSAGGLYAFVEAAAGRTAARVHGAIWIVSYFLYLPATVTFLVYELLPALAPGLAAYRPAVLLLAPFGFAALVLAPLRISLAPVAAVGVLQLVLLLVLGGLAVGRVGWPLAALAPHGNANAIVRGAPTASLLLLCASLPLYLGAAVHGGGVALRRSITGATAVVGGIALFAAVPLAATAPTLLAGELPAQTLAGAYGGHTLAVTAGAATIASIGTLVFAEYLALGRLVHAATGIRRRNALLGIGAAFLAADALALLGPNRAYDASLRPALAALYLSQFVVFAVYPRFERRRPLAATTVSAVAAAPLVWGLYLVLGNQIAS